MSGNPKDDGESVAINIGNRTIVIPSGRLELTAERFELLKQRAAEIAAIADSASNADAVVLQALDNLFRQSAKAEAVDGPPAYAERLLRLVLNRETEEAVLGDLQERFTTVIVPRHGRLYAKVWYWRHAIATALGHLLVLARGIFEAWRMGTGG